jgi:DNA repair protein RadD
MFTFRDYQNKSHSATMNFLSGSRKGSKINVVPTGGGKSLLQAKTVHDYGDRALIISPTIEILKQNYQKFVDYGGQASIYSAKLNSKEISKVTYASLGSIKDLGEVFHDNKTKLLIIDECHINTDANGGMLKKFISKMKPKYTLGYTATPFRLDSQTGPNGFSEYLLKMLPSTFPKIFDDFAHVTQIEELIKNKFWADIQLEQHEFDTTGLFLNSTGNDYDKDAIVNRNKEQNINNRIYKRIKQLMPDRKSILVFMDSVENCEIMRNALGSSCEVVHGKTKTKDRERIISDFKSGVVKVVLCHSTLVVGFDFPGLDTVIMGRPTNSLAVFYQIYGRLVRPSEGKLGLFIDFGGNLAKFGDMHNITIENYRGIGYEVFYKDRMVSGTPLKGEEITKRHLDELVERKMRVEAAIEPNVDHILTIGKHKGNPLSEVPKYYLDWLLTSNLPLDNVTRVTIQHILKKPTSLY